MKNAIIPCIVILFAFLFYFSKSNKDNTVTRKTFRDTILRVDTFYLKEIKLDSFFVIETDTFEFESIKVPLKEYFYNIDDSLLTGTIKATAPFKPSIDFEYKLNTYTIKDSIYTEKHNLNGFLYGGEVVVSPLLSQIYAGIGYQNKMGSIISLSVGRDFERKNNLIKIGLFRKF